MGNVFCYPSSKGSSRVDESIRVSSLTMTSSRVTCDMVCIDFQRLLSWLVLHQDIRCFEELQVWYHHHHHIRSRGRARHNPQMLWCFSHLTRHRRCTYYRQYESCTLISLFVSFLTLFRVLLDSLYAFHLLLFLVALSLSIQPILTRTLFPQTSIKIISSGCKKALALIIVDLQVD